MRNSSISVSRSYRLYKTSELHHRARAPILWRIYVSDVYVRTERGLQREQEHHSQTHEEALLGADVFEWKRPCQCALTLGQLNLNSEPPSPSIRRQKVSPLTSLRVQSWVTDLLMVVNLRTVQALQTPRQRPHQAHRDTCRVPSSRSHHTQYRLRPQRWLQSQCLLLQGSDDNASLPGHLRYLPDEYL